MKLSKTEVTYIKLQSWKLKETRCKSKTTLLPNAVLSRGLGLKTWIRSQASSLGKLNNLSYLNFTGRLQMSNKIMNMKVLYEVPCKYLLSSGCLYLNTLTTNSVCLKLQCYFFLSVLSSPSSQIISSSILYISIRNFLNMLGLKYFNILKYFFSLAPIFIFKSSFFFPFPFYSICYSCYSSLITASPSEGRGHPSFLTSGSSSQI